MAGMKQIKATVGEYHTTIAFLAAKPQNRFLHAENTRMQEISPGRIANLLECRISTYFNTRRKAQALGSTLPRRTFAR